MSEEKLGVLGRSLLGNLQFGRLDLNRRRHQRMQGFLDLLVG